MPKGKMGSGCFPFLFMQPTIKGDGGVYIQAKRSIR